MKRLFAAVAVFLAASSLAATNGITSVTAADKEWKDIRRVSVGSDGRVVIVTATGGGSVDADKLTPDFLRSWGITEEGLASAKASKASKTKEDFERAVRVGQFRVVDGVVYDLRNRQSGWATFNVRVIQVLDDGVIGLIGNPSSPLDPIAIHIKNLTGAVSDTDTVTVTALLTGSFSYINKEHDERTIKEYDIGRTCKRTDIPDAIAVEGKAYARVAGKAREKRVVDVTKSLPDSDELNATGSGFFVSEDGYLVTNAHVVEDAKRVKVRTKTGVQNATIVEVDKVNDLALLKVTGKFKPLPIASEEAASLGDAVFTIGFPNIELQGLEPKYTDGKISSLAGIQDDPVTYQISVPIQSGNSGGPLVDARGFVVGVVVAKLNDAAMLRATGSVAQSVNYAVKAKYLRRLMTKHPEVASPVSKSTQPQTEAVKVAEQSVAMVLVY